MNLKDLALIAVVGGACLLSSMSRAEPLNCTGVAVDGLQRIGVRLKTVPNVVVNRTHPFSGWYRGSVVTVWDNRDCVVMVHEFYHHYQAQRYAIPAFGSLAWMRMERDAQVAAERVFEENPDLPKRTE